MSEQIAPCPYCGCQVSRLIAGDVHCGACGFILTSQMFAHLSRAAALLRAVEGLSEIGKLRTAKLAGKWQATVFDRELGIDHVSERFDAPVDALIALWAWRKEARDAG